MHTPVALIIFKRPETTRKVLDAIRQVKPSKLFVIANAPRLDRPDEIEKCAATRSVINEVDWDCEVTKKYSEIHFGVGEQISNGLSWIFDQVEEAIIVEDDCILHPSFFPFCEEMLERYRHDTRIFSISAQNVQLGQRRTKYSYYFSRYSHLWGWATWRRAWKHYDYSMKMWPEVRSSGLLHDWLDGPLSVYYWQQLFQDTYDRRIQTWDYQWTFSCWLQGGLSVMPEVNMVKNIGFDGDATHFGKGFESETIRMPMEAMEFPLKHPINITRHVQADRFAQQVAYQGNVITQFKNTARRFIQKNLSTESWQKLQDLKLQALHPSFFRSR